MNSTLEAIQFFANSENTVRVFEALDAGPATSSELAEQAGASSSTIGRILDDGESRGWIESAGNRYELTVAGEVMIDEFRSHMETIDGVQHLGDAINWLPPPVHAIDFRDLRDAVVTRSTPDNPAAPFDRGIELIRAADTYRGLTSTAIPSYVRELRDGLVRRELDFEGVIEAGFLETLRGDPERAEPWYDLADAEATWIYDGRVPINMHVIDGVTLVWLGERVGDDLEVYGLLESENPSVSSWAESLYEEFRSEAELLDGTRLPGE